MLFRSLVSTPAQPDVASFRGALEVALAAGEVAPNDADAWRWVQGMAQLDEEDEAASSAAMSRALKELGRLDPADPFVQLDRLTGAVERGTTADDRIAAYAKLLQGPNRDRIPGPVASRLAFDLALLEKRRGNADGWGTWLRDAVALDPAFQIGRAHV